MRLLYFGPGVSTFSRFSGRQLIIFPLSLFVGRSIEGKWRVSLSILRWHWRIV